MNLVKQHWETVKRELQQLPCYDLEKTIDTLKEREYYKKLEGKARNRSLWKEDKVLFTSIYRHTKRLEEAFKAQKAWKGHYSFYKRVLLLVLYNGDIEKLRCKCKKKYSWTGYCRHCPDYKRTMKGKQHSEETKLKQRRSTLKYLESVKGQLAPRYNRASIQLIEKYGKDHGYKFMHAENGGEYFVRELGYFLDAYDPINNVALEIDEKHHFDNNGELKERDLIRQHQIETFLNCEIIRIKYDPVQK